MHQLSLFRSSSDRLCMRPADCVSFTPIGRPAEEGPMNTLVTSFTPIPSIAEEEPMGAVLILPSPIGHRTQREPTNALLTTPLYAHRVS